MPVVQDTVLSIACDNPSCPGNGLPADDRTGWTFVNTEIYGQAPVQFVYCSADCAGTVGVALDALAAASE
jgi:hypothetical protein